MGANSTISLLFYSYIIFSAVISKLAWCAIATTELKATSLTSPTPNSNPTPSTISPFPPTASNKGCSTNLLNLAICTPLLDLPISHGVPLSQPCCSTLYGLLDVELSLCLCLAIKANILGININVPIALRLLLDTCNIQTPISLGCA